MGLEGILGQGWRQALRLAGGVARQTVLLGRLLPSRSSAVKARELGNQLEVFETFHGAESIVGLRRDLPVAAHLRRLRRLPVFTALWVAEGLAYSRSPDELDLEALQAGIPLHTGMGMRLAREALRDLERGDDRRLGRLPEEARKRSRPGYGRLTFEPLGFVARTLHPGRTSDIDRRLERSAPELRAWLWHGVGRGLYFSPTGDPLVQARSAAPDEVGRRNATAGAAWALTLVNLRHPEVVAAFLAGLDHRAETEHAVVNGITSAALLWLDGHGLDPTLTAFLDPPAPDRAWTSWVTDPFERARERYRRLVACRRLEELFICPAEGGRRWPEPRPERPATRATSPR